MTYRPLRPPARPDAARVTAVIALAAPAQAAAAFAVVVHASTYTDLNRAASSPAPRAHVLLLCSRLRLYLPLQLHLLLPSSVLLLSFFSPAPHCHLQLLHALLLPRRRFYAVTAVVALARLATSPSTASAAVAIATACAVASLAVRPNAAEAAQLLVEASDGN